MSVAKKQRESNLELFRIIVMILIVAHHYVVNSGLLSADGPVYSDMTAPQSLFLLLFGAWGKTGINCFVLISGYFMCKSQITAKKFVKLVGEWVFYSVVIYFLFCVCGYQEFTWVGLVRLLIPISRIGNNFTDTYFVFLLCIPFLNVLVHNLRERQHLLLVLLCVFVYVLLGTLQRVSKNYVSWFIVLYLLSSYIRLYPKKIFSNRRFWGIALCCSLLASVTSIVAYAYSGKYPYYFLEDANVLLSCTNGLCGFMFFKNIRVPYSRCINTVAASTFGVLCIHANSDTMRKWLWQDVLNCTGAYGHSWGYLHAIASVLGIFAACTIIDMLRIRFVERPFFELWDRKYDSIHRIRKSASDAICRRLHIG